MVTHLFMPQKTLGQIFYWPLLIALLSGAGLVTALLCDHLLQWVSDAAVALPVLVAAYFYWLKKPTSKSTVEPTVR